MDFQFSHNKNANRFELWVDNKYLAEITYTTHNGKLYLNHTGVPNELSGQGIGKILTIKTFEVIRAEGLQAIAVCPYLVALVKKNPAWNFIEV